MFTTKRTATKISYMINPPFTVSPFTVFFKGVRP